MLATAPFVILVGVLAVLPVPRMTHRRSPPRPAGSSASPRSPPPPPRPRRGCPAASASCPSSPDLGMLVRVPLPCHRDPPVLNYDRCGILARRDTMMPRPRPSRFPLSVATARVSSPAASAIGAGLGSSSAVGMCSGAGRSYFASRVATWLSTFGFATSRHENVPLVAAALMLAHGEPVAGAHRHRTSPSRSRHGR